MGKERLIQTLKNLGYQVQQLKGGIVVSVPNSEVSIKRLLMLQKFMESVVKPIPEEIFNDTKMKLEYAVSTEDGGEHNNNFGKRLIVGQNGITSNEMRKDIILMTYLARMQMGVRLNGHGAGNMCIFPRLKFGDEMLHDIITNSVNVFLNMKYDDYLKREYIALSTEKHLNIVSFTLEEFTFERLCIPILSTDDWDHSIMTI